VSRLTQVQILPAMRRLSGEQIVRYIPSIVVGIAAIALGLFVPDFFTARNIINVLMQSSALGLMAIGVTAVLIGGGIDLSIPSVMALSGIFGAMYMRAGGHPVLAGLIMVAVATLIGTINGFAVAYLRMIPFVVTLSMMYVAQGACLWVTRAISVPVTNPAFVDTVMAKIWTIPVPVIFLLLITAIVTVLIGRSLHGRWLYATGTNIRAARVSGILTARVLFGTYVFSGFFAGLAAIVTTARLLSAAATMGEEGVVLSVISSAVVGGVSIYGGVGSPLGAVIGALFITLITNSMNLMHVSYYATLVIKGLIIVTVVALDSLRRRYKR